jgi:hypothetical protein
MNNNIVVRNPSAQYWSNVKPGASRGKRPEAIAHA